MKKILFCLILSAGLITGFIWNKKPADNIETVEKIAKQLVIDNTKDSYDFGPYSWNMEGHKRAWTYQNGLMMYAFLNEYKAFVDDFYDDNVTSDGLVNNKRNFLNSYRKRNLDFISPIRPLFYLQDSKNFLKYKKLINFVFANLREQPTLPHIGNNYRHKVNNYLWEKYPFALDGLSSLVILMEIANNPEIITEPVNPHSIRAEVFRRMNWIADNMQDSNGLYNHGTDGKNLNGFVWLRAVGWYAMAQVDIIELMPEGDYKSQMEKQLVPFFDNMLLYRDEKSKMWYNVLNSDVKNNRLETSGSAMMSYAMLKACNNGFVDNVKYCHTGLETFNGIMENKVKRGIFRYKVKDIYLQSNVKESAEEYCNKNLYVSNDAKGVGPLILATKEAKKLKSKEK